MKKYPNLTKKQKTDWYAALHLAMGNLAFQSNGMTPLIGDLNSLSSWLEQVPVTTSDKSEED